MSVSIDDFYRWSVKLYGLEDHPERIQTYMSDLATEDAERLCDAGSDVMNDKARFGELVPEDWAVPLYGYVANGVFTNIKDDRTLTQVLASEFVIVKPSKASHGDGVELFLMDHDAGWWAERYLESGEEWVVTGFALQHDYANHIWPNSANSLRFLCFYDGSPRIADVVHKWGLPQTGITDNFSKGSVTTLVSPVGRLLTTREDFTKVEDREGRASDLPGFYDRPHKWFNHPVSRSKIYGVKIPFWEETLSMVNGATEIVSDRLPYIAWDVIITDGGPLLIEGNPWPGIQLIQVHRPLFANRRFLRFMQKNEVKGVPDEIL